MRETIRSATVAGLAILAVALAAATLDSTESTEQSASDGPLGLAGEGRGGLVTRPRGSAPVGEAPQIPFLTEVLTALALVVAFAILVYAFRHWRRALGAALFAAVLFGVSYLLFEALFPLVSPPAPGVGPSGNGSLFGGAGGGGGGESEAATPYAPSLLLLFVLALALVGTAVALFRTTADEEEETTVSPSGATTDVAAVGRVAGDAADRIEGETDLENEVYRAWHEMTRLLDVDDPRTSTPGEFSAAAIEAGLGRDDVGELTRLFEDVRYGETPASETNERRAVGVFRRIEDRYAEDGP